jgi:hypothetical protein
MNFSHIDYNDLPENEHDMARHIQGQLSDLESYIQKFKAAIDLFDYCDLKLNEYDVEHRKRKAENHTAGREWRKATRHLWENYLNWKHLATRDGAMTIFHFAKTLIAAKAIFGKAPTLKSKINLDASKKSGRLFNTYFPDFETIRHTIAHTAELKESLEKRDNSAINSGFQQGGLTIAEGTNTLVSGVIGGRTFSSSIDGKMVSYDLSNETLAKLKEVQDQFLIAFENLDGRTLFLERMGLHPYNK